MRRQAESFLNNEKDWKAERDEYEELIEKYKKYAEELEKERGRGDSKVEDAYSQVYALSNLQCDL